MIRRAAPGANAARRLNRLGKEPMNLEQFIERQKVIALWREISRSLRKIPDATTRDDMRKFARDEFQMHRNVKDIGHIRYLLSTGKTQFQTMEGSLINSGVLTK